MEAGSKRPALEDDGTEAAKAARSDGADAAGANEAVLITPQRRTCLHEANLLFYYLFVHTIHYNYFFLPPATTGGLPGWLERRADQGCECTTRSDRAG